MESEIEWLLKEKYHGEKSAAFFTDVERLKAGEPLGFIIGHVPFLNCTIYLDSHPLIPRPETEYWVEKAIAEIRQSKKPAPRVLDLCAGSGAIGVAVAHAIPAAKVTLVEIDKKHLPTIGKNLNENKISCTDYQVFQSDLFENIVGAFDFILTNPPYIDRTLDRTDVSVKDFEPAIALYGGAEGMELIARIIEAAPDYLTAEGVVYIEHEPEQSKQIKQLAESRYKVRTECDQYGVERYSILHLQSEKSN